MASIHERFGLLQERYEKEVEQHRQTIGLIQRIQRGEVELKQVVVFDNADGSVSWSVTPPFEAKIEAKAEAA